MSKKKKKNRCSSSSWIYTVVIFLFLPRLISSKEKILLVLEKANY